MLSVHCNNFQRDSPFLGLSRCYHSVLTKKHENTEIFSWIWLEAIFLHVTGKVCVSQPTEWSETPYLSLISVKRWIRCEIGCDKNYCLWKRAKDGLIWDLHRRLLKTGHLKHSVAILSVFEMCAYLLLKCIDPHAGPAVCSLNMCKKEAINKFDIVHMHYIQINLGEHLPENNSVIKTANSCTVVVILVLVLKRQVNRSFD